MRTSKKQLLIAVVGPTASGKSQLALRLAEYLSGEIVNCDSMQMIKGMEIGTAKPTPEERARVPHHLYEEIDPSQFYSAGRYMVEGRRVCSEISSRGRVPIVVGGTGLYLRSLLEGLFPGPGRNELVRRRLSDKADQEGTESLYRELKEIDPVAAGLISPADRVRLIRALEVCELTGRRFSVLKEEVEPISGFRVVKLGLLLARPDLYARIDRRVERMFRGGLLDEVGSLLKQGYAPNCKGFEALGYRQAVAVLSGVMNLEQAIAETQQQTRRYAKRQLTWFRREQGIIWIEGPGESELAFEKAKELLETVRR